VLTEGAPFDPAGLRAHVQAALSGPARPTFVRVMPELSTTSTFKLKKGDLQKEGFDPRTVTDPLYLLDPKQDQYVPLTEELYDKLVQGRVRL
jgi:hypothetical protein